MLSLCSAFESVQPNPAPTPGAQAGGGILEYYKVFDGECGGDEILMYEGDGDNEGTSNARTRRCAEACDTKKTPLGSHSWDGFVAMGFIIHGTGRCFCESPDSATCNRGGSTYSRYDWGSGPLIETNFEWEKVYEQSNCSVLVDKVTYLFVV